MKNYNAFWSVLHPIVGQSGEYGLLSTHFWQQESAQAPSCPFGSRMWTLSKTPFCWRSWRIENNRWYQFRNPWKKRWMTIWCCGNGRLRTICFQQWWIHSWMCILSNPLWRNTTLQEVFLRPPSTFFGILLRRIMCWLAAVWHSFRQYWDIPLWIWQGSISFCKCGNAGCFADRMRCGKNQFFRAGMPNFLLLYKFTKYFFQACAQACFFMPFLGNWRVLCDGNNWKCTVCAGFSNLKTYIHT